MQGLNCIKRCVGTEVPQLGPGAEPW